MGDVHPDTRPRTAQRMLFIALVSLLALCIPLLLAGPAGAGSLTGGFSPTIVGQGADVNGNGIVNASDDANAFYGDTSIIDGKLDCDAWGTTANDGSAGSGTITTADDCSLVGYDGTPDGITIEVVDGAFQVADGQCRHRRFRLRLVGDRRPRGLERQRSHRQRRLPCRGRR
jgi:hypothetical protein